MVSLYISTLINLLFVVIKIINGIRFGSAWFISVGIYYALLAFTRFSLLVNLRREHSIASEYRIYRNTGVFMLVLNTALIAMIAQMILTDARPEYPVNIIFINAAYSIFLIALAVNNVVKYRRFKSPILSAVKAIGFLASLVSILMFQTTLLEYFGENTEFIRRMDTVTGAGVAAVIIIIAVDMIRKGTKNGY